MTLIKTSDPFFDTVNIWYRDNFDQLAKWKEYNEQFKINYPVDIWKTDEFVCLEFPILQGKSEDIGVKMEGDVLKIKYQRSENQERQYIYPRRIVRRDFDMSFKIGVNFDKTKITSKYEGGVLSVFVPYAAKETFEIEVK